VADVEARLNALEAERDAARERAAVLEALHAYSHCIDTGDEAGWVDCFTVDGAFEMRSAAPGYPSRRVSGRSELEDFIAAHSGPPLVHHKHLYLMPDIAIEGTAATAIGYVVHLVEADGALPELQSFGRYFDALVKADDDRWRIAERVVDVEATSGRQR
jgi:SnoaL-like domain